MEVGAGSGVESRSEGGIEEVEPDSCRLRLSYTKPCLNLSTIVGDSEKLGRRDTDADASSIWDGKKYWFSKKITFRETHIWRAWGS